MSDEDSEDNFLSADEGSEAEETTCTKSRPTASFPQELISGENLNDCINYFNRNNDPTPSYNENFNEVENTILNVNLFKLEEVPTPIPTSSQEIKVSSPNVTSFSLPKDNLNAQNFAEDLTEGIVEKLSVNATTRPSPIQEITIIQEIQSNEVGLCQEHSSISDPAKEFINRPNNTNIENIVHPKKSIKESKIGLKKPREKLGERLGNKKLGSRVTKPLVGIGYNSPQVGLPVQGVQAQSEEKETVSFDRKSESEGSSNLLKKDDPCNFSNEDDTTSMEIPGSLGATSSTNWGSWGDWGSTLVSAASTLTKEVSRGMESVMESVETGLGAPDPAVLARETVEIEKLMKEGSFEDFQNESEFQKDNKREIPSGNLVNQDKGSYSFGLGGFGALGSIVSGVSGALETASNTVLIGGLETLEKIGRKTMDVIQEGDPGLRRKRAFLHSKKPNLSTVLKEARERALDKEDLNAEMGENSLCNSSKIVTMAQIWDGTEGSAHLEALCLVAKQCQRRTTNIMQELPALGLNRLHPLLAKIKACNEIDEEKVFANISKDLNRITRDVQLPLQFGKLMTSWPTLEDSIKKLSIQVQAFGNDDKVLIDIQRDLFEEVAVTVSHMVGVTHKAAELSLITSDLNYVNLAQQFRELCSCISSGLEASSDQICESVTRSLPSSDPIVSSSVTNIYVQMAEANSYIQNALQHLVTVLVQAQTKQVSSEL